MAAVRHLTPEALHTSAQRLAATLADIVALVAADPAPEVRDCIAVVTGSAANLWPRIRCVAEERPTELAGVIRRVALVQQRADRIVGALEGRRFAVQFGILPERKRTELRLRGAAAELVARELPRPSAVDLDEAEDALRPAPDGPRPPVPPLLVSALTAAPLAPPRSLLETTAA